MITTAVKINPWKVIGSLMLNRYLHDKPLLSWGKLCTGTANAGREGSEVSLGNQWSPQAPGSGRLLTYWYGFQKALEGQKVDVIPDIPVLKLKRLFRMAPFDETLWSTPITREPDSESKVFDLIPLDTSLVHNSKVYLDVLEVMGCPRRVSSWC